MRLNILITGGTGFLGSHTTVELIQAGHNVVILDNLSNSSVESIERIKKICNRSPVFVEGDILNLNFLDSLFKKYQFDSVIHFAGLKAVEESARLPLLYYRNNFVGTLTLLTAMEKAGVFNLVFSSSATVYGEQEIMPIREDALTQTPLNPYGKTKLMIENLLSDIARSDERWSFAVLRYFNPVGAHPSGLMGEVPKGVPNNLLPYIGHVAIGKLSELNVFGNDYDTEDGTGVRDYIHVMDLVDGHLKALNALNELSGFNVWNLGSGRGYSVLELLQAYREVSKREIPFKFQPRRSGDIGTCWADISKAARELDWRPTKSLTDMVSDAWRWQINNPNGYDQ